MRVTLLADCTRAVIEGRVSVDLLDAIERKLTFQEPGAWFTPQYKRGLWDGKRHLFKPKTQTFPVGLLDRVLSLFHSFDIDPEINDERPQPWGEPPLRDTRLHGYRPGEPEWIDLFDDQREALDAFLTNPRGCLELPTSAGKTEIAAALFKTLGTSRALMICNRKSLASQTRERLQGRLAESVGLIGAGFRDVRERVIVATIQSLWYHYDKMARDFFPQIDIVVVDEAHAISPKMWFQTLEVIPAPVRLGLSATIKEAPRRMIVESYLGPIIHHQEITDLIELGRVATPNVAMLRVGGTFDDAQPPEWAYWHGVVTYQRRNNLIVDAVLRAQAQKKPVLVLCVRLEHGRLLKSMLEDRGLAVPFLYGSTPLDVIDNAKRNLERGDIPAIIASTIFDQGIDIPDIRALIVAGGGRSPLRAIQRIGRAVRKKPSGDNTVHVLDFMDMGHKNLRSQARDREGTYRRKKLNARVISTLDEWLE